MNISLAGKVGHYDFSRMSCATWWNCIHSVVVFMVEVYAAIIHINSNVSITGHFFFCGAMLSCVQCPSPSPQQKRTSPLIVAPSFKELCHSSCSSWAEWKTVHQLLLQRQLQICKSWTALWPFMPALSSSKCVDLPSGPRLGCCISNMSNEAVMGEPLCSRKIPDQSRGWGKRLSCLEK